MSTPISAITTRAAVSLSPGIVISRVAAARKGSRASLEMALQRSHGRLEGLDLGQVQLDHEAMKRGHAGGDQLDTTRLEPSRRQIEIGQAGRVGLTGAARAEKVAIGLVSDPA